MSAPVSDAIHPVPLPLSRGEVSAHAASGVTALPELRSEPSSRPAAGIDLRTTDNLKD